MAESQVTEKLSLGFNISKKKFAALAIMFNSDLISWIEKKGLEEGEKSKIRNVLPEPFDWFNHAGNLANSMWIGLATSTLAGAIFERRETTDPIKANRVMWSLGATAALGLNLLAESRLGVKFMSRGETKYTSDIVDVVYGFGAGCVAASVPVLRDANTTQQRFTIF